MVPVIAGYATLGVVQGTPNTPITLYPPFSAPIHFYTFHPHHLPYPYHPSQTSQAVMKFGMPESKIVDFRGGVVVEDELVVVCVVVNGKEPERVLRWG